MKPLSVRQKKILDLLCEYSNKNETPSIREIGKIIGVSSTGSIQADLDVLEKQGYIERVPMHKRSIRIVGQKDNIKQVPLYNTINDMASFTMENIVCYIPIAVDLDCEELLAVKLPEDCFDLNGFLADDIIVVGKSMPIINNDLVLWLNDNHLSLNYATFLNDNNAQSENIVGKVIASIRYY